MKKEKELKRIAQYLLLHGSATSDIGLLNGKMGICLFFYHYSRLTGNEIYKMYAEDILDEIYSEINIYTPVNFRNGLCGIAWGICYLKHNKFVEADLDIVLKKLDTVILERNIRRISDISLETGLKGIAYYVLSRCADGSSLFAENNADYLSDLLGVLNKATIDTDIIYLNTQLEKFIVKKELPQFDLFFKRLIKDISLSSEENIWEQPRPIGIANRGFTGIGLNLLNIF